MFANPEEREEKRRRAMAEQAQYLVRELGKLKGSVVKIGQMMALYGEHFLPPEITQALHQTQRRHDGPELGHHGIGHS
jgi:predicted unusual protein kinase regulating ubiquinone biosynthesis (AarF/ABC1/UbiB family)